MFYKHLFSFCLILLTLILQVAFSTSGKVGAQEVKPAAPVANNKSGGSDEEKAEEGGDEIDIDAI